MNQTLRIIGGLFRGKKISFPAVEGLRPTPDRVRETVFNWLMHAIRGTHCLDAFSGSGALGFEALSRGAEQVTLIEPSEAYYALRQTASTFKTNKLDVLKTTAQTYLKNTKNAFDIIFLDPPFASDYLEECLLILATSNCLKKTGLVYVESPQPLSFDPTIWHVRNAKQAGQVFYALLEKR